MHSVEFLGGMATVGGWRPPAELPEIAFSGRSNVGKSSLLNRLVRRRKVARVSNTPGRTREINFFSVNGRFVLVDFPGYGYARASKEVRAQWRPLVASYVAGASQLRGIVQLVDVRREPTPDDLAVMDWYAELGVPVLVVVTKTDTVSARACTTSVERLASVLGVEQDAIVPVSSKTGSGRDELAHALVALLDQPSWRPS